MLYVIWLVTRFMKLAQLQWFDRLLRGGVRIYSGLGDRCGDSARSDSFRECRSDRVRSSELAPYFLPGSRVIAVATPYELKAKFLVGYRAVERWWREQ